MNSFREFSNNGSCSELPRYLWEGTIFKIKSRESWQLRLEKTYSKKQKNQQAWFNCRKGWKTFLAVQFFCSNGSIGSEKYVVKPKTDVLCPLCKQHLGLSLIMDFIVINVNIILTNEDINFQKSSWTWHEFFYKVTLCRKNTRNLFPMMKV